MAVQLEGALEGYDGCSLDELTEKVKEMVAAGSISRLAQLYPGGGSTTGHHHGPSTFSEALAAFQGQFWCIRLCEALSGTTVRMGSWGWVVSCVMGLFSTFGMDWAGQGSKLDAEAARQGVAALAAAGLSTDVKSLGTWWHLPSAAPEHGVTAGKSGSASILASLTLCWRIESDLLLEGSLQRIARNFTQLFEDSQVLEMLLEGAGLASQHPTAAMLLRQLPTVSSLMPAMTFRSLLSRALSVSGMAKLLGGMSCQYNEHRLMATQVGWWLC